MERPAYRIATRGRGRPNAASRVLKQYRTYYYTLRRQGPGPDAVDARRSCSTPSIICTGWCDRYEWCVCVVRDWSSAFVTFPYCLARCVCHCHHFGRLAVVAPFAAASLSLSLSGTLIPRPPLPRVPCTPIPSASFSASLPPFVACPAPPPAALSPALPFAVVNASPVKSPRRHPHSFPHLSRCPRRQRARGRRRRHCSLRHPLCLLRALRGSSPRCSLLVETSVLLRWNTLYSPRTGRGRRSGR